jgi:hypothetical protein
MKKRAIPHSDNWKTPPHLYNVLDREFRFDFDPCPYSNGGELGFDGLTIDWGQRNFVNPPYSQQLKERFVRKAIDESYKGKVCVVLLPVSTSTRLFHEYIYPNAAEIRFIRGRVTFQGYNTDGLWTTKRDGMHDSMVVVFDGSKVRENIVCSLMKQMDSEQLHLLETE